MNLTIANHKTSKPSFIHLTTLPMPIPPLLSPARKQPKENRRDECGSMFFVNCLNGNATEHTEQNEISEDFHIHKPALRTPESPYTNTEERKRKI
jgi:hypothetical protein